eukprot:4975108-Prymnesium_polylepis.2
MCSGVTHAEPATRGRSGMTARAWGASEVAGCAARTLAQTSQHRPARLALTRHPGMCTGRSQSEGEAKAIMGDARTSPETIFAAALRRPERPASGFAAWGRAAATAWLCQGRARPSARAALVQAPK